MNCNKKYLCDKKGHSTFDKGMFFTQPIICSNLSKKNFLRRKKWNYWTINNDKYFFTLAITNFDYSSLIFLYLVDLKNNTIKEQSFLLPLGRGVHLKENVEDNFVYEGKNLTIKIIYKESKVKIELFVNNFYNNDSLMGSFDIYSKNYESLNIVVPWSKKKYAFTCKQNAIPCDGSLSIGNEYIKFNKNTTYASQDFGRGVWKRNIKWNWMNCSATIANNKSLGINLGSHWTDGSGITENGIILDGKAYKIAEDIEFNYDNINTSVPWTIKSKSNNIDLVFTPLTIRDSLMNFKIVQSSFHQLFGKLNGKISIDDLNLTVENSLALCEEHIAKW